MDELHFYVRKLNILVNNILLQFSSKISITMQVTFFLAFNGPALALLLSVYYHEMQ